jgi:protein-S-isoprenylcysteine O-methyltransferase Ste14
MSRTPVEIADEVSRKRSIIFAVAAIAFLLIQVVARPYFLHAGAQVSDVQRTMWAVNAGVLLLCLATGGGLLNSSQIRMLVNDEVSRANYRKAVTAGFWVAMIAALGLYAVNPPDLTARQAVYLIVTASVAASCLGFAWLEHRAHRDG